MAELPKAAAPKVVEAHRMAGDVASMLHAVATDLAASDAFYKRLIAAVSPKNVSSRVSMERIRGTTALPTPEPPTRVKSWRRTAAG